MRLSPRVEESALSQAAASDDSEAKPRRSSKKKDLKRTLRKAGTAAVATAKGKKSAKDLKKTLKKAGHAARASVDSPAAAQTSTRRKLWAAPRRASRHRRQNSMH